MTPTAGREDLAICTLNGGAIQKDALFGKRLMDLVVTSQRIDFVQVEFHPERALQISD